jgi:hypothetical protein
MQFIDVLRRLRFGRHVGAFLFLPALLTGVSAAKADLVGANVSVGVYCCTAVDPPDLFTNVVTGIVPADFPEGSLFQTGQFGSIFLVPVAINVDSDQIILQWIGSGLFASGSFNGFHFEFSGASAPQITNVTLDPLSTLNPVGVSFAANSIDVNVAGQLFGSGANETILDISTSGMAAIPEPATWAMMLVGFAGLGFVGYGRAREPRAAVLR